MDHALLVNRLKETLREKFPNEKNQARLLSDVLGITENSVYRKFKGNRQFTLEELARIAHAFSISVDKILGEEPGAFTHRLELILTKNMSPQQRRSCIEETSRSFFKEAAHAGYSKFMGVCKNIPIISYCYYDWLMKFARLKWLYFNNYLEELIPLTEMDSPEELQRMGEMYRNAFNSFRSLVFIVDGDMVWNFILDLRFFQKIGYLTIEEINFLLEDLESMLNVIEEICREGHSGNPHQEIAVFYSEIALYNDIYVVESTTVNQGVFFTQGFIPIIHKDERTFKVLRESVSSCIRSSNPICGVADTDRKVFFEKQYHLVDTFRNSLSPSSAQSGQ